MPVGRTENPLPLLRRDRVRSLDHGQRPHPVDQSDRKLHRTAPIHAFGVGALVDPTVDLRDDFARVARISGQVIGTRENREVLMSVRLPNDLRVTGNRVIAVINPRGKGHRSRTPSLVFVVPEGFANDVARIDGEELEAITLDVASLRYEAIPLFLPWETGANGDVHAFGQHPRGARPVARGF